jgi:hypothetical protein
VRQQRQLAYLAEFTSDIVYIPGKQNVVVDTLSRPGGNGGGGDSADSAPLFTAPGADLSKVETCLGQLAFNRPGPQSSSSPCFSVSQCSGVDFAAMAAAQEQCTECKDMQKSAALKVKVLDTQQF